MINSPHLYIHFKTQYLNVLQSLCLIVKTQLFLYYSDINIEKKNDLNINTNTKYNRNILLGFKGNWDQIVFWIHGLIADGKIIRSPFAVQWNKRHCTSAIGEPGMSLCPSKPNVPVKHVFVPTVLLWIAVAGPCLASRVSLEH